MSLRDMSESTSNTTFTCSTREINIIEVSLHSSERQPLTHTTHLLYNIQNTTNEVFKRHSKLL